MTEFTFENPSLPSSFGIYPTEILSTDVEKPVDNDLDEFLDVPPTAPEPPVYGPPLLQGTDDAWDLPWGDPALAPIPTITQIIGEHHLATKEEETSDLPKKQKRYIDLLSRRLFLEHSAITGESLWNLWPVKANVTWSNALASKDQMAAELFKAGLRPSINDIQVYIKTAEFYDSMNNLGVEIDREDSGLTVEQLGLLDILSNYADGKDLRQKLRHAGISWAKFNSWKSQKVFGDAYRKLGGKAVLDAIPMAEQQLAQRMAAGDTAATKFAFELSGHYNPAAQKQVDAKALIGIIFEILEEEVKDPEILRKIGTKLQLRGQKAVDP